MDQLHRPRGLPVLDLSSVYAKLDRAEEHFKAADTEISAWLNGGRYEPVYERGSEHTRLCVALTRIGPAPDVVRWGVIIGDCFNNLRSCLDHLIYAFAKFQSAQDPTADIEKLAFIIADLPGEFTKSSKSRLRGFTEGFIGVVESFQPYNRRHPSLPPLLSIIRDLSNADKHRLLQVAAAGVSSLTGTFQGDSTLGEKVAWINPNPIEQHDIVCVITSRKPDPHLTFQIEVGVCIWHGLREGDSEAAHGRTGYSALIPLLIQEVQSVIERFKRTI